MHELEYEREIAARVIHERGLDPWLFELEPAMSLSPRAAYLDAVRDADIFVLVLWTKLSKAVAEELDEATRGHKPVIVLVRSLRGTEERDAKLRELIEELSGRSPASRHCVSVFKEFRSLESFERELRAALAREIQERYRDPVCSITRSEMYDLGVSILRSSTRRILVFERTPSLFLGPRPYTESNGDADLHQRAYVEALNQWLEGATEDPNREFLYLFSPRATVDELRDGPHNASDALATRIRTRIQQNFDRRRRSGRRIRFATVDKPFSGPLIVGDERYALWIVAGDDAVAVSQRDRKLCDVLARFVAANAHVLDDPEALESVLGIGRTTVLADAAGTAR